MEKPITHLPEFTEKRCPKCMAVKPYSDFPKRNKCYCRVCAAKLSNAIYHKKKNDPGYKERLTAYYRNRRHTNSVVRITHTMRARLAGLLKRASAVKTSSFNDLLGCTPRQAVYHLTGGNYEIPKGLHVDHHVPCAFFDLTRAEHQRVCFNWRNLRLLTAEENVRKADTLPIDYREIIKVICSAIGVDVAVFNFTE